MSCPREQLSDLVYGFASADDAALLRHVRDCAACRGGLDRLRDEHSLFSAAVRVASPRRRPSTPGFALGFAAALLLGLTALLLPGREEHVRVSARLDPAGKEFALTLAFSARSDAAGFLAEVTDVRDRKGRPVPFGPDPIDFDGVPHEPSATWAATSGFLRVRGDAVGGSVSGRVRVLVPKEIRSVELDLREAPRPVSVGGFRMAWSRSSSTEVELRFEGPRRHVAGLLLIPSVRVDDVAARVDPGFGMSDSKEFYPYRIAAPEGARSLRFDFILEGVEREVPFTVGGLSCGF
jgi:hypothetical protein